MTERCKFPNFDLSAVAKLIIPRTDGVLKRLYVHSNNNEQYTIFLLDDISHLRMYSFSENEPCLEGVHILYERKDIKNAIKNILFDQEDESLTVLSENHVQKIPFKMLCGPSFIGNCVTSFFCSKYADYCKEKRQTINNPINQCKKIKSGTVASNDEHTSDLYPCNTKKEGCLIQTGKNIGEGRTPDIVCPSEFCMCRVRA